ncbi:MAG: DUF1501 domain-containing protein [Candidatus Omnitrophica bacterium]|nr:DUF1501 domain-containing protein [Candidatus Omnitrophota bacterium]
MRRMSTFCPGPSSRRDFLKVGFLSGLGLSLGDYFSLRAAQAATTPREDPPADSAILIFLDGGLSHLESFDPKPEAPIDYRGDLGSVRTVTGEYFGGLFPQTASIADKIAIIRTVNHSAKFHLRAKGNMLTGRDTKPEIIYPSYGSIVSHELGPRANLPAYTCIPSLLDPNLGYGYLGLAHSAFTVEGEPLHEGFKVKNLNLPSGVSPERMEKRRTLLEAVDSHTKNLETSDAVRSMDEYYDRAYALISSKSAREAFDITTEPQAIRDEYGMTAMGQRLLLSRRLVEAGARFVTVFDQGWDLHEDIKPAMEARAPGLDRGYSTLIRDLERRGLLDRTLVILATEFGRSVQINHLAGRDHWWRAFSIALAGGGIQKGIVYGKTDAHAAEILENPVSPEDLAATILTQLGISPSKKLLSPGGRPVALTGEGSILFDILA